MYICGHEKIKSVNCKIFCMLCGEELPLDYLVAKQRIKDQKQAETPPVTATTDDLPASVVHTLKTPENSPENENVAAPDETPEKPKQKKERKRKGANE